jgi:hypothetical protein
MQHYFEEVDFLDVVSIDLFAILEVFDGVAFFGY